MQSEPIDAAGVTVDAKPRVGIVIPVYNTAADHLGSSVRSALDQTVPVDVVVVDDGSFRADTLEELDRLRQSSPARVVTHPQNLGVAAAKNTGIAELRTPYILVVDSDDWVEPTYAALASAVLDERPEVAIVTTDLQCYGDSDELQTGSGAPRGVIDLLIYSLIPAVSVCRRADWQRVGGYDTGLTWGEDHDFWLRVLAAGATCVTLDAVQYHYRIHGEQTTVTTSWEDKLQHQLAMVRRNPHIWADHIDVVMEELWKQQAELRYYRRRYGRADRVRTRAGRAVRGLRSRLRSAR